MASKRKRELGVAAVGQPLVLLYGRLDVGRGNKHSASGGDVFKSDHVIWYLMKRQFMMFEITTVTNTRITWQCVDKTCSTCA